MQSPDWNSSFSLSEDQLNELSEFGWVVIDSAINQNSLKELKNEAVHRWEKGQFKPAEIGRGSEQTRKYEIRGDSIFWLEELPLCFSTVVQNLQNQLNKELWLGINNSEFHFAMYPANSGYQAHIDQSRHTDHLKGQRLISFVLYLNEKWEKPHAGELCIHTDPPTLVAPIWGRIVLFKSQEILHSVMPSTSERWSLTGWFRKL